mmetsp:Transcript_47169/g.152043  ORF Transcript_47169/g.152043 Transcript_47169/m.152043 type:complete len:284 (+) Transcript_47169:170-1021(+)
MAAHRERRDPVMTRQSYGAGARTTSTSCASTPGCTTRTPARSAGGSGSSPVRRSQLQRRPARREAPQQTADRREADFGLRHAPRPGRIGFLPFSAFSPCGYLFPVCTSSVNEYDGIQSGRGLAAHCTHVDTRKYEGNHTRTHLPPRASPRRRASIERVCARGEGRGRWGRRGEAPGFGPSALALAQDPVERVIRFQIRRPRIKAAQIWRARSGLHRQRCRAGSVSGGVPPPAGLRRKKHASVQRARRAAHSYKRCQSAGSSPPGGTETGLRLWWLCEPHRKAT